MFNGSVVSVVVRTVGVVVVFLASPALAELSANLEISMADPERDAGQVASSTNDEEISALRAVGDSAPPELAAGENTLREPGLVGSKASAKFPEPHGVLFVRGQAGLGTMEQSGTDDEVKVDVGGIAVWYAVSMGASVLPNLALFGELAVYNVPFPNLYVDGRKNPRSAEYDGETVELALPQKIDYYGAGGGLAYYIMPANVYLSASFNVMAGFLIREDLVGVFYLPGYVGRFAIGKEWWTTIQGFGLGVAATATVGKPQDLRLTGLGLAISATYN